MAFADLYHWQVELLFKWIKQYLRIKSFFGTSEHAVKNQLWIAISVYVLVAIIKKRLDIGVNLFSQSRRHCVTVDSMPVKKPAIRLAAPPRWARIGSG